MAGAVVVKSLQHLFDLEALGSHRKHTPLNTRARGAGGPSDTAGEFGLSSRTPWTKPSSSASSRPAPEQEEGGR
jgi:hypothetical protein